MDLLRFIQKSNMRDVDLNLLRLFDTIYRTRNISRAAEALDMSQPATSQALSRLRSAVGDHLFERTPGGVRPTPRAERLAIHPRMPRADAVGDVPRQPHRVLPHDGCAALRTPWTASDLSHAPVSASIAQDNQADDPSTFQVDNATTSH